MTTEIRCAVEIRSDETSPGRLVGTLLRYGDVSPSHRETFERGSLEWPADGVVLKRQHKDGDPIMRIVPIERDGAVVLDSPLPDTTAGRDAARELRDGLFTGLSVEFRALMFGHGGGLRRVKRAKLTGAGLVHNPSYPGSAVEVRERAGLPRFIL